MGERHEERAAPTVNDLCDRYLEEHAVRKREYSRHQDESLIRQWDPPRAREEEGVRRAPRRHRAGAPRDHQARRADPRESRRGVVSKMFNLAVRWEMVERSPVPGVERNHEEPRHRYLDGAELGRLVEALAISPNRDAANVIRLLLLTGARRMEVMAARWEQFDLGSGTWTKPAAFTKQNKLHSVPLSAPARLLLAEMREAADRRAAGANRPASPFLFPTPVAAI